eukprot:3990252-Prorocentrum_lima.AAC.1
MGDTHDANGRHPHSPCPAHPVHGRATLVPAYWNRDHTKAHPTQNCHTAHARSAARRPTTDHGTGDYPDRPAGPDMGYNRPAPATAQGRGQGDRLVHG